MGQHKHNPTAILAKEGKLPPKEPKIGKPERRRILRKMFEEQLLAQLEKSKVKLEAAENELEKIPVETDGTEKEAS